MAKRRGPTPSKPWQTMRFSHIVDHDELEGLKRSEVWGNDRYSVNVHRPSEEPGLTVIGVRSRTRASVGAHDWRHMQRIKNDILGPEVEAVELFPAESRLVDTANEFWLWCLPPGQRFPFGFETRDVSGPEDLPPETQVIGPGRSRARQRRLT